MRIDPPRLSGRGLTKALTALSVLAVCLLSACGGNKPMGQSSDVRFVQNAETTLAIPDTTSSVTSADLRISPLDILDIKVFGVSELNGEYQVDQNGSMKFPLLDNVEVKGNSIFELADLLEAKLEERYIQEPDVTVKIKEAFTRTITVEGAVKKPGVFPVTGELSLLQAIALAEGITDTANPERVVVFRTIEGQPTGGQFNLEDIRLGNAKDPDVYGNDIIVVDGSEVRKNYREFLRSVPLLTLFFIY